ncbi:MAG: D-alanyl-D-alanine carboxypeptidase/D-alanyl-D-alanine-endopeptidase [Myxococcota bacterium]|nr:D-alanyl-D-alanine carboxypeptidase/D-alanyl-D-alanine-endopeptidase [Myxococcota bacterium]
MSGRVRAALATGLALLALLAVAPRASSQGASAVPALRERLDASLRHPGLRGARIAALVVSREDGRVLYARDPDRALVPASNMKVLTAIAALSGFGPAHRFPTQVLAETLPDAEGVVSDLYVRGGGDPTLTSEDLWRLAADLRRAGLRRVSGDLVLDASLFDAELWHPSWGRPSARAYHAPVSALSVNYGAYAVQVTPGAAPGQPLAVTIDPAIPFLRLANRGRTGPARGRSSLVVDRRTAGPVEEVVVSGALRAGGNAKVHHRSVLDPVGYAGAVLRMQLAAVGVEVDGATRRGPVPEEARLLLRFEGKSVAEIVRLFVKYSNNAIAESLVKALGARAGAGSAGWNSGLAAMRAELAGLGIDVGPLTMVDGSGLSYENRVSPRSFVEALQRAHGSFRFGPEFVAALPIAAADGTLSERAEGAAHGVRAKTGLLTRVTGLSGYAELPGGGIAVFSILTNGWRGSADAAMAGVDAFVAELVRPPDHALGG